MFNLFARVFSSKVFKKDHVGIDRISNLKSKQEFVSFDDKDVKIEIAMEARDLWARKKDLLSRAKQLEFGDSWRSNTVKGKQQRISRTDLKLQETRDRALKSGVWEIETY